MRNIYPRVTGASVHRFKDDVSVYLKVEEGREGDHGGSIYMTKEMAHALSRLLADYAFNCAASDYLSAESLGRTNVGSCTHDNNGEPL